MAAHAARLSRLFTPAYAAQINAQMVYPAHSVIVNYAELESVLSKPLQMSIEEPRRSIAAFAATLSYHMVKGHPFLDGNNRTAFFLSNEYVRAHGVPGLADNKQLGRAYAELHKRISSGI